MATLSSVPQSVDLSAYGGDTFSFSITAPSALVDGMEWLAQIRSANDSTLIDAVFDIIPPTVPDGPAFLTLPSSETRRLVEGSGLQVVRKLGVAQPMMVQQYKGVWDCQVSGVGGIDPVVTLVVGTITIDLDVSRAP